MKRRSLKVVKAFAVLLMAGSLYVCFYMATGRGIPCIFHLLTGLQCPGCGITRMCGALIRLDFATAWESNPAILILIPAGCLLGGYTVWSYIRTGGLPQEHWYNVLMGMMIGVLVIFGIVRNLFP